MGHPIPHVEHMSKFFAAAAVVVGVPVAVLTLVIVSTLSSGAFESAGCGPTGQGAGVLGVLGVSIMGPASVDVADMVTWYSGHGYADPTGTIGTPISTLAGYYLLYGDAEGVRGDVAFIQAVLETGGFTNIDARQLNNFAGIGHCDSCGQGMAFSSVAVGVDAQIQLLKKVVGGNAVTLAGPDVAPTWGGRQASDLAGLAANWASSPVYAVSLSGLLGSLLATAGAAVQPGPSGAGCVAGGMAFPLPPASIRSESWLTKPHHDFAAADIPVPAGTDVNAPVSGKVVGAPVGGDCGLGVSIRDAEGDVFTLCHGGDGGELVAPGDTVSAGELVMHSGFTGHVEPPGPGGAHLHVQIQLGSGGLVCPQTWLDALFRGQDPPAVASLPTTGCTN